MQEYIGFRMPGRGLRLIDAASGRVSFGRAARSAFKKDGSGLALSAIRGRFVSAP
jgi:hypothetical protein